MKENTRQISGLLQAGFTRREIMQKLSVSGPMITYYARKVGMVEKNRGRPIGSFDPEAQDRRRAVRIMRDGGMKVREIGKFLGVSTARVDQMLHPDHHLSRTRLHVALKHGKMLRPNECSRCGKKCKPEAHHSDYSKPYDIEWLCTECHAPLTPRAIGAGCKTHGISMTDELYAWCLWRCRELGKGIAFSEYLRRLVLADKASRTLKINREAA